MYERKASRMCICLCFVLVADAGCSNGHHLDRSGMHIGIPNFYLVLGRINFVKSTQLG